MSLPVLMLWLLNMVTDTVGQLAFKAGAMGEADHTGVRYILRLFRNPWVMLGIGCYVLEFFLWLGFLSLVPLSNGILLGSINIVAILLAGRVLFHERINRLKCLGILFVVLGVLLVGGDT